MNRARNIDSVESTDRNTVDDVATCRDNVAFCEQCDQCGSVKMASD